MGRPKHGYDGYGVASIRFDKRRNACDTNSNSNEHDAENRVVSTIFDVESRWQRAAARPV